MKIKFVNLKKQWNKERKDLLKIIDRTINSGDWVGGKNIQLFDDLEFAQSRTYKNESFNY